MPDCLGILGKHVARLKGRRGSCLILSGNPVEFGNWFKWRLPRPFSFTAEEEKVSKDKWNVTSQLGPDGA
jgi:hypothetical protein